MEHGAVRVDDQMTPHHQVGQQCQVAGIVRIDDDAVFVGITGQERDAAPVVVIGVWQAWQPMPGESATRRFDQQHLGTKTSKKSAGMFGQRMCNLKNPHTIKQ